MKQPVVPLLTAISVGIILGNSFPLPVMPLLFVLTFTLTLLLYALIKRFNTLLSIFTILSFFVFGLLIIQSPHNNRDDLREIVNHIKREPVIVEGWICETPHLFPHKTELTISTSLLRLGNENTQVEGLLLLSVPNSCQYKYGDYVRFETKLRSIRNFNNPGVFDYKKHMSYRGIFVRGQIKDESSIVVLREHQGNPVRSYLEEVRSFLRRIIQNNTISPEKEILQAMILGEQQSIPRDIMEKFNKTGTTHILAISGFNIGVVAFFSVIGIRVLMKSFPYLLLRFNLQTLSTIIAIVPVVIYAMIAGMGISVFRATIMAITFMLALVLGKENDLYNTLALAALIILLFLPYSLFDVSFQLSFAAVWAILFITPKLMKLVTSRVSEKTFSGTFLSRKHVLYVTTFVVATISATVGTLPLIVYYFNRVSTVVLLSNFFVTPLLGMVTIPLCVMIIFTAFLIPSFAVILVNFASFLIWISVVVVDFFASIPCSSFFIFTPTITEILLFYIIVVLLVDISERLHEKKEKTLMGKKYLWHGVAFALLSIIFIGHVIIQFAHNAHTKNLSVTFVDVGQGNSSFIRFPGGKTMLVDGGGFYLSDFDVGKNIVAPYLWHERVNTVDIVVLTHPHPDHLNGLLFIVQNFNVKEVWTNGQVSPLENYRHLVEIMNDKGIIHRRMSRTMNRIHINGVDIQILNPEEPLESDNPQDMNFQDINDNAIVMRMKYGMVSYLFPSDISEEREFCLIKSKQELKSQIMLVPHHGSLSSSSIPFIKKVQPEIAVISCGADNINRLPHTDVIKRYERYGTAVYRTDIHGAVIITTDGHTITRRVFHDSGK